MRIVAGRFKGKKLHTPTGMTTRPTSDRAREGLFNILAHGAHAHRLRGGRCADLFAGSGAVGLEAVSRGAAHCAFYETDRQALKSLTANINACNADEVCTVYRDSALTLRPVRQPFDLVFLDPPYAETAVDQAIGSVLKAGLLARAGLLIAQSDPTFDVTVPAGLEIIDDRRYGAARFVLMACSEPLENES